MLPARRHFARVLLVEDDERLGRLLERILTVEGFAVDLCQSGADAVTRARGTAYDLVLLDWMIPDLEGIQVCRQLRRSGERAAILMLTGRDAVGDRVLGLDAGADDYLVKPFQIEELIARIHALVRRSSGHSELRLGHLQIDHANLRALLDGEPLRLTAREFSLLLYIAHRSGEVVARNELMERVWLQQFDPDSNLVDVHISRLRDKLGKYDWMIETVRGRGYRLRTNKRGRGQP